MNKPCKMQRTFGKWPGIGLVLTMAISPLLATPPAAGGSTENAPAPRTLGEAVRASRGGATTPGSLGAAVRGARGGMTAPRTTGAVIRPAISEETWIFSRVTSAITQMMGFAAGKEHAGKDFTKPPKIMVRLQSDTKGRSYNVQEMPTPGRDPVQGLVLKGLPWDVASYLPWAKALADVWGVSPQTAPDGALGEDGLISLLTVPTMENFLQADKYLSSRLTTYPADSKVHEETALLLASVAWSEAAGTFSDTRGLINTAYAHLVMAKALRAESPATPAGRLAELTLLVLTRREAEADKALDAWPKDPVPPQAIQAWLKALRLANLADWRAHPVDKSECFLLLRTYYRALAENISAAKAFRFYGELGQRLEPDWARIALGQAFNVAIGNTFSRTALENENFEIAQVMVTLQPTTAGKADQAAINKFLNEKDEGPWQDDGLAAVSRGLWAERMQRHLLGTTTRVYYHLQSVFSDPEAAKELKSQFAATYKDLRQAPVAQVYFAEDQTEYDPAAWAMQRLWDTQPEAVSVYNWRYEQTPSTKWAIHGGISYVSWFRPLLPEGTGYDAENRIIVARPIKYARQDIETWLRIAPHGLRPAVAKIYLEAQPTPEQARAILGELVNYNLYAANAVATVALYEDFEAYPAAMQKVCDFDPNYYLFMGDELFMRGKEEPAMKAYQKAVELDEDDVAVSDKLEPLVLYYYGHDRQAEAVQLAQRAAEVYSERGLITLTHIDLCFGKYSEALRLAKSLEARYQDESMFPVVYNHWAQTTGNATIKAEAEQRLAKVFPAGKEPARLTDFKDDTPPTDGTQLLSANGATFANGMRTGDIVVAIDGTRVRSLEQYDLLLNEGNSLTFQFVFWRAGKYMEATIRLPDRHFYVYSKTYAPGNGGNAGQ